MRTTPPMPLPVKRTLAKLGIDIKSARLRRRITTTLMAERAFVARSTLQKVEQGDPGVSLGVYATVFFILGLSEPIADLADGCPQQRLGEAHPRQPLARAEREFLQKTLDHALLVRRGAGVFDHAGRIGDDRRAFDRGKRVGGEQFTHRQRFILIFEIVEPVPSYRRIDC